MSDAIVDLHDKICIGDYEDYDLQQLAYPDCCIYCYTILSSIGNTNCIDQKRQTGLEGSFNNSVHSKVQDEI